MKARIIQKLSFEYSCKAIIINLILLVYFLTACPIASAEFVNGVETFDGTIKDATVWEEYNSSTGTISQNDQLIINTDPYNYIDYTTRNPIAGIGDIVSVELNAIPQGKFFTALYLTTNSAGTSHQSVLDDYFLRLDFTYDLSYGYQFSAGSGGLGSSTGSYFTVYSPAPSESNPYILQIERISNTEAIFNVFEGDRTLVWSHSRAIDPNVPDELNISLAAWSENAGTHIFDNVAVVVPEPISSTLFIIGGATLGFRRFRKRRI